MGFKMLRDLHVGEVVKGTKRGKMYYMKRFKEGIRFVDSDHRMFNKQTIDPNRFIQENDIEWEKVSAVKVIEGYKQKGSFMERKNEHDLREYPGLQTWLNVYGDYTKLRITIEEIEDYEEIEEGYSYCDVSFGSHEKWGYPAIEEHAKNILQDLRAKGYEINLEIRNNKGVGSYWQPYFYFRSANDGNKCEVVTIGVSTNLQDSTIGIYDEWIKRLDTVARKIENTWEVERYEFFKEHGDFEIESDTVECYWMEGEIYYETGLPVWIAEYTVKGNGREFKLLSYTMSGDNSTYTSVLKGKMTKNAVREVTKRFKEEYRGDFENTIDEEGMGEMYERRGDVMRFEFSNF